MLGGVIFALLIKYCDMNEGLTVQLAIKMVGIWFPISAFVAIGFEHIPANMFTMPLEQALRHMNSYKKIPPKGDACPKVQKTPQKGYPRAASLMRSRSGWGSGGGMSSERLATLTSPTPWAREESQGTSP